MGKWGQNSNGIASLGSRTKATQLGISQKANPKPINRGQVALPPGPSHRHTPPPAEHQSHHRPSEGLRLTQGGVQSESYTEAAHACLSGNTAPHSPPDRSEAEMPANQICVLQSSDQNLSLPASRVLTNFTKKEK